MDLSRTPAWRLRERLLQDEIAARDVALAVLGEIERSEPRVRAYLTLRPRDEVLAEADALDAARRRGEAPGPLFGIPVSLKDNLCTRGLRTTCASRMLEHYVPPYDATVVERVRAAGALVLGKTNLDEFAMGSSTENSALQETPHPQFPEYVPGGTSGGAAASVAAGEAVLALGSDTGGSIRQPASFCGVVGMKPTYGRVSRYGLVAYASSFDQIGPLARDVRDAALLFSVIAGHDPRDATSVAEPVPELGALLPAGAPARIGVPREYFGEALDAEVRARVEAAIDCMGRAGHAIVPISLEHTDAAIAAYYVIACAEASSNLARYDGVRFGFRAGGEAGGIRDLFRRTRSEGFGPEVKRRILLGTYVLSAGYYDAYYLTAMRARTLVARDFEAAFARCDVIMHPVAPTPAYRRGTYADDVLAQYLGDAYTVIANLVGLPAISVPCGATRAGLPVGVQLAARRFEEATLFRVALDLERRLVAEAAPESTAPPP